MQSDVPVTKKELNVLAAATCISGPLDVCSDFVIVFMPYRAILIRTQTGLSEPELARVTDHSALSCSCT